MKKQIKILLTTVVLMASSTAIANHPNTDGVTNIEMTCQIIENSKIIPGPHRTSPTVPNVYLDQENAKVYFENPCYECTLELVIPDTDTTVYTTIIPDGDNTVQLPTYLTGQFELHIHRGIYCFWGLIELP